MQTHTKDLAAAVAGASKGWQLPCDRRKNDGPGSPGPLLGAKPRQLLCSRCERERERGVQSRADVYRGLDLLGVAMLESIEARASRHFRHTSAALRRSCSQGIKAAALHADARQELAKMLEKAAEDGVFPAAPRPRPPPPLLRFLLSLLCPKRAFAQRTCLFSQPEPRNQIVKLFDAITSRLQLLLEEAETSFNVRSKLVPAKY